MKKYVAPDFEIVYLETEDEVNLEGSGIVDPVLPVNNFAQFINDLPNGTILNPDGTVKDHRDRD